MPRRRSDSGGEMSDEDGVDRSRKNPRRGAKAVSYKEDTNEEDRMDVDEELESPASGEENDKDDEEMEDAEAIGNNRRRSQAAANKKDSTKENMVDTSGGERRKSSRATKFKSSMKEPSEKSILDVMRVTNNDSKAKANSKARNKNYMSDDDDNDNDDDNSDMDDEPLVKTPPKKARRQNNKRQVQQQQQGRGRRNRSNKSNLESPHKSPARRHKQTRLSINTHTTNPEESDESSEGSDVEDDDDDDEEEEPFKIQRIIASRTEKKKKWAEICKGMNTTEIDDGSRWVQDPADDDDEDAFEERFLVKWADISYMHVSWETELDLLDQVEGAKSYLKTFFRKSSGGYLFDADERCDGDYFDPAWAQIDRIVEVQYPETCPIRSVKDEDKITNEQLGIVLDKSDPTEFENGLGREFLVKWGNQAYSEGTYEFERDLILNDVEYKDQLKQFLTRTKKPTKDKARKMHKEGEAEHRRLYKSLFGDSSKAKDESGVEEYQKKLEGHVYKNGGQLRDYQAVGVSWLMANLVNKRSCILADEMGLGKTLQTASFINLIATQLNRRGPFLIIAPLSTLAHWQREFMGWTDLNTIVYHGSARDRDLIRELEFAYEIDRPKGGVGFNQLFLRKCKPKKGTSTFGSHWMAEVVITTPELLTAEDFVELTAVKWECLVVDEAQKLKNHSSKLATNLRDDRFEFNHKLLLTGTPIQNSMEELFALMNFIDPVRFPDCDEFMEQYGDIKSKEKVDQLHEEIRPYILRRLKEDAEKSVPPKEETVIEVELTVAQKQYYRALYEKNVKFLHKDKKKALDGPSLNNLAMQLRKCCNHLFLLNGVEESFRESQKAEGPDEPSEGDLLVKASGKLVLLDKLLPRLKEKGHRILIFSQFSRTLDILEDYLSNRTFKFERIDGSITGKKRQQAIDRFQAPTVDGKEQPFIMLLTTRAGGVGINLTAADTCIIFDSDWNPQNDLQAQARCHRIGQTKNVKVFRLLTRNTYELQMFHMSSMKMGLDQAVLSGFESGSSGGTMSKEEVEKLLRHGAYGIFSEDKEGEEESNAFVDQDIDTILERRSRKVVHENTGTNSSAAGGTFSKARFTASKGPEAEGKKSEHEDVDIDDPDFWRKMVGEGQDDSLEDDLAGKRRKRTVTDYSEGSYEKKLDQSLLNSDAEGDEEDNESDDDDSYASDDEGGKQERSRWGGRKPSNWKVEDAKKLVNLLLAHGYGNVNWLKFVEAVSSKNSPKDEVEVKRMCWSLVLLAICEMSEDDASAARRRAVKAAEKKRAQKDGSPPVQGGVLAGSLEATTEETEALIQKSFEKQWAQNSSWAARALKAVITYAKEAEPRSDDTLQVMSSSSAPLKQDEITTEFAKNIWPSLKNRGWKVTTVGTGGQHSGTIQYTYKGEQYQSPEAVLAVAGKFHSDLSHVIESLQTAAESSRLKSKESEAKQREQHLAMKASTISIKDLKELLSRYAPLQLLYDRKHQKKLKITTRKLTNACNHTQTARILVERAEATKGALPLIDHLASILVLDKKQAPPHPLWTSRHDAVLIHAIHKHGWIEEESSARGIIDDPDVHWGFPFDSEATKADSQEGSKMTQKDDLINSLKETAGRAAGFLNDHRDILKDVKNFNQSLLVRTYCLAEANAGENENENEKEGEENQNETRKWEVDEEALVDSTGLSSNEEAQEVDLPPKKELAKRIKHVLSKNVNNTGSQPRGTSPAGAADATKANSKSEHQYCVIDQSDRCNIFLAEILVAVIKAKTQNSMKLLCALACEEAKKRKVSILARPDSQDPNKNNKRAKAAEEMSDVVQNVGLAKKFLKQTRQAKNVLRVIVGQETVKALKDSTFPVESKTTVTSFPKQRQPANGTRTKKEDSACGDRALAKAISKCYDKNNGGPGRVSPEGHVSDLELTAIETLIISVVCSQGLPVWNEDMSSLLVADDSSKSNLTLSWIGLGSILSSAAKDWHETASQKVEMCQQEYDKHQEKDDQNQLKVRARKNLANAIRVADVKETAAVQASEYAEDASILAQKTVMLIERLRRKMGNPGGGHTKPAKKANNLLGAKVFDFLATQLSKWANALDIVDGKGDTLAYTAADFYHDLPDEERTHVEVAATLNKQDCRNLLIQITSVSRLRSLFMKYGKDSLLERIGKAASSTGKDDPWESQPVWWKAVGSKHDSLLVESLVEYGFGGVLENSRGFGPPDKTDDKRSLKDLGLTKAILQHRVNQLTRELHAQEVSDDMIRVLQENKSVNASSKENNKNGTSKTSKGAGKKQTALHSFFGKSGKSPKKAGSVVVLSDGEEDDVPTQQKKNDDTVHVVEIDMSPPPPKEAEDDSVIVVDAVSGEKRANVADPPGASPSPEKKQRSS